MSRIADLERELAAVRAALETAQAEAAEGRFFRRLVLSSTDIISVIGADGLPRFVSPSHEAVTGIAVAALEGKALVDLIHPDDYARMMGLMKELLESPPDRVMKAEFRRVHAQKGWIYMEATARNLTADPDVRGIVTSGREVTDAVRLREQLRESQTRFETAMQASKEAFWERDLLTDAIELSPDMFRQLGYEPGELPRTTEELRALLHPDDRTMARAAVGARVSDGQTYDVEVRIRRKPGGYRWYRLIGTIQRDEHGRATRMIGRAADVHDRKVAEIALRDSERMFRALFEDTSVAVTIRDVQTQTFIDCNTAALRLYGFRSHEELNGTTPVHLASPTQPDGRSSREVLRLYVEQAMREGAARMIWVARRQDGREFPAEVKTTIILLEDGRRIMQTLIEDISERRRSEEALRYRARRDELVSQVSRRFVQEAASVALPFALEVLGSFLGVDRVRMRRFSDDGTMLTTLEEWTSPGTAPFPVKSQEASSPIVRWVREQLARSGCVAVSDTGGVVPDLRAMRHAPGAAAPPMRALLVVPVLAGTAITGWIILDHIDAPRVWSDEDVSTARLVSEIVAMGQARDAAEARTRRQAARDELLSDVSRAFLNDDPEVATGATLERLGSSFDAERASLFTIDEQRGCLRCTHRWVARAADASFESLEDYPVPDGASALGAARSTPDGASALGAARSTPDGPEGWLEGLRRESGKRILHAPVGYGGRVFGLLTVRAREGKGWSEDDAATCKMIAELIAIGRVRSAAEAALAKAKEDAVAASLTKSAFLANMSHELRTPLNGVIGMVDLLATTTLDERQRRYTEIARTSANLLLSVISDILDFSKIEAGKLEIESVELAFNEIVEEVASILALSAESKALDLSCQSSALLDAPLVGDPARLRQVLVNLVSNAIKFTRAGEVSVVASLASESRDEARVRVEVRDTGVGIPLDAQERLFQPFTQVDASTTRQHGGTGLGLAICRELIERMGGTIGLTSAPGVGSTFWFEVPLAKGRGEAGAPAERDPRLTGLRVLGVDDSATNRDLLRAQLDAAGMHCDTAEDGPEALRMLLAAAPARPYALAVLDHHMPGMDGRELARRVTADARLRGTRLVMLGSVANPLAVAEQRAAGIVGYCTKPIWRKQLLRVLRAALEDGALEEPADPGAEAATRLTGHLLLVEDSPINAEVAAAIVRSAGYTFDLAHDGLAAILAVKSRAYDLVLMDCQLPEVDGYEATRRIRALEHERALPPRDGALPVIALTASATKGDLEKCFAVGMNGHVSKPVDARRLLAVIARHLRGDVAEGSIPPPPPSVAVADLARALARLQGDRALLRKIASQFADGATDARARLRTAVERRDGAAVAFATHRLRGQASSFDGEALIVATEGLEAAARRESWTAAAAALLAVEGELDRLLRVLAAEVGGGGSARKGG